MDNNIQPDYSGAYAKIYEKATPESGTGKYYKEGKPTAKQLANRPSTKKTAAQKAATSKYEKIKALTNAGKHKEASALYNEAKYDNTKSPDYKKKKAALAKKHGGYDKIKGHPQYEEVKGRHRLAYEKYKAELHEGYVTKFSEWTKNLHQEGYDLSKWELSELLETYIRENDLFSAEKSIYEAVEGIQARAGGMQKGITTALCPICGVFGCTIDHSEEDKEEEVKECIENAVEYFYDEGINEEGLEQIIEEVGLDEFVEFVLDTDEYGELNEERKARKLNVKTKRTVQKEVEKIKANKSDVVPRKTSPKDALQRAASTRAFSTKKPKLKKPEGRTVQKKETPVTKATVSKPKSKPVKTKKVVVKTIKPIVKKVKAQQPKKEVSKGGLRDRISSAVKAGVKRHKKAVQPARVFAKGAVRGAKDTVKFAGKVKKVLTGEEFSDWKSELLDEADITDILARLEKKRISKGGDPEESPLPAMRKYHSKKKKKVKKGDWIGPPPKKTNEEVVLDEEGYDHWRDRNLEKYGTGWRGTDRSGPSSPPRSSKKTKGKTVLQRETEKKYGKGKSALDIVKQKITDQYGKGAIMSTKKGSKK